MLVILEGMEQKKGKSGFEMAYSRIDQPCLLILTVKLYNWELLLLKQLKRKWINFNRCRPTCLFSS